MHFVSLSLKSCASQYSKSEWNQLVEPNLLLSWILHNRTHRYEIASLVQWQILIWKWSVQSPHWVAWLQFSVGGTVKGQGFQPPLWPHGPGISRREVSLYRLPMVPTAPLACGEQRNEGMSWGRWETSGAVSPLPDRSPLTQVKWAGRHIPGTWFTLYCRSISNLVKWTKISTSSVQMLESARDFQHGVMESQSCYEKESWLSPSLRDLVLRLWFT